MAAPRMPTYDDTYFRYIEAGAMRSAERMLPLLLDHLDIGSVLDVGCGRGAWLAVWRRLGVEAVTGVDGDYVDRSQLLIPAGSFQPRDLTEALDLGARFDLVQCLEVAEHLPPESGSRLVDSLVHHGDLVLFSAAPKGQGGDHHVNEQDYEHWRRLFARHGFVAVDYLRPIVLRDGGIERWYRYNAFLYASPERLEQLPEPVRARRVPDDAVLRDCSPILYRLRKALIRPLPVPVVSRVARARERLVVGMRGR
jgi:SAM-dependent methyltransferase